MSKKIFIINKKDIKKALIELVAILNRDEKFTIRYYKDCCRLEGCRIKIEYIDNKYKVCYNDKLIFENDNKNIVSAYIRSRL